MMRAAMLLAGLAAPAWYLLPGLCDPGAHWPLRDVGVYRWGGQQAVRGAALFAVAADAPGIVLRAALTAGSVVALPVLCWLSVGLAGCAVSFFSRWGPRTTAPDAPHITTFTCVSAAPL